MALTTKLQFKYCLVCQVWTLPVWQSWHLGAAGAVSIRLNVSFYSTSFYRQFDNLPCWGAGSLFLFLLCLVWCPSRPAVRWLSLISQQMTNLHWVCSAECSTGVPASTKEWHGLAWESGNEVGTGEERAGGFLLRLAVRCETNSAVSYLQNHQVSSVSNLRHVVFKIQC